MATGGQTGEPEDDGVIVEAEYYYEADEPGELSIKKGDIVRNVHSVALGWFKGELNGKRGIFPSNYVKIQSGGVIVEAEYSYEAEDPGDLSIKKGDIIKNVHIVDVGWSDGELNGKKGMFPNNYVKILSGGAIVEAKHNYKAEEPAELSIRKGDIIKNANIVEDGWSEGELNGKRGIFPNNYAKIQTVGENQKQKDELRRAGGYHQISGNFGFYPMKVLGHGSHATVYEGEFGQFNVRAIAVKVVKCSNKQQARDTQTEIVNIYQNIRTTKEVREIKTMELLNQSSDSTNIIQFIDSYIHTEKSSVYLAFELAKGTLHDYIEPSNVSWQDELSVQNVVQGIVSGMHYTHEHNLVHRDLKPENIFIVEYSGTRLKAVIGDFGSAKATIRSMFTLTAKTGSIGYIPPEIWSVWKSLSETEILGSRFSRKSDIFSLALVIYFVLSLGKHPYGNPITAQENFPGKRPTFQHITQSSNLRAYEIVLSRMLNTNPDQRPTIQEVRAHPALWSSNMIMKFLVEKSDKFETLIRINPANKSILEDRTLIKGKNWMNKLPVNIKTYLENYKVNPRSPKIYNGKEKSIKYLLRAVRNTERHHHEYPANTQTELGTFPDGHIALWLGVCPGLLMHVYDKLGP